VAVESWNNTLVAPSLSLDYARTTEKLEKALACTCT
jgi:hypothetical protein